MHWKQEGPRQKLLLYLNIINELLIQIYLKLLFMPFTFEKFRPFQPFLWKAPSGLLIKKCLTLHVRFLNSKSQGVTSFMGI